MDTSQVINNNIKNWSFALILFNIENNNIKNM